MSGLVEINYWAEGPTDRAVARKLIRDAGGIPGADYSQRRGASSGKDYLDTKLRAFNAAAQHSPWLVLRDSDGACPVELATELLGNPARWMRLRIVVPAMEAWLMADRQCFASFLGVAAATVPKTPEDLGGLKDLVLRLAGNSRKREIREDFLPVIGSGRREGPGYASRLIEFIENDWDPDRCLASAPSLRQATLRLKELIADNIEFLRLS